MPVIPSNPPKRVIACVLLLLLVLWYLGGQLMSQQTGNTRVPTMSKPSIFYRLGKSIDSPSVEMQKWNRQMWEGTYEMDALFSDPNQSAWASGRYETAAEGVSPDAVGRLPDQELLLFREDMKSRSAGDWRYSPPDIRNKHEDLRNRNGLKL